MKRVLCIILLLLCGTVLLHGQTVVDSEPWYGQGKAAFKVGKGLMIGGAASAALGGGILWLSTSLSRNQSTQSGENMGPILVSILGVCGVVAGTSLVVAGIPVTIAGHSIMQCDEPWRDARYSARGLGAILESGYLLPGLLQVRASLGYHFNSRIFLGAGVAPGWFMNRSSRASGLPGFSLPLYADFRWSFNDRLITPYLGCSAGMELSGISPYLGAEMGIRIRTSRSATRSFWGSLTGEVTRDDMRAGIKMGYSF